VEVVAAVAVLFGSVAQAVTGFGFSLVCAPFLVAAYDAPEGVQINLVVSTALNVALLMTNRRGLDRPSAIRLLIPAVVATIVLGLLIRGSDNEALTVVSGALCLVGVAVVARGRTFRRLTGRIGATIVGALSGAMNVVAGIGGPPVVLFGTTAGWSPEVARPTLQAFFLGINIVALATLGLPDQVPLLVVAGMLVGLAIGHPLSRRLHADQVRVAVLVTAGAGSILAIVRGLT
jgi:uncharacterized membrane protein YfcA